MKSYPPIVGEAAAQRCIEGFRSARTISADGPVAVDPAARLASSPRIGDHTSSSLGDVLELIFKDGLDISERVISTITESQSQGIEGVASFNSLTAEKQPT